MSPEGVKKIGSVVKVMRAFIERNAGDKDRQFTAILSTLGQWIDAQPDPGRYLSMALELLGKHREVRLS